MKIAIDNRAVKQSGIGAYSKILLDMLPQQKGNPEVIPYGDLLTVNRSGFWNKYVNGLRRVLRDQFGIAKWQRENHLDLFHNPRNIGTALFNSCKVVTTIHDVIPHIFPQYYLNSPIERLYYEIMIRISIASSDKIITISNFSKQELMRIYRVPGSKIVVTPLACNEEFIESSKETIAQVKQKYGIKRPYLMTIGGSEYRKNVKTVLEAYKDMFNDEYDMIVIGGAWRGLDLSKDYTPEMGIGFLTRIPNEDLIALYSGTEVFIYASFYEGFGLPLLEAMGCNIPVIAAAASCLPEVAGDAVAYFSPFDVTELRNTINKVLHDDAYRNSLVEKGAKKRLEYSWEKVVEDTYKVYCDVLQK